jgi:hypothetical protein
LISACAKAWSSIKRAPTSRRAAIVVTLDEQRDVLFNRPVAEPSVDRFGIEFDEQSFAAHLDGGQPVDISSERQGLYPFFALGLRHVPREADQRPSLAEFPDEPHLADELFEPAVSRAGNGLAVEFAERVG